MREYVVNRPDERAMEAALRENFSSAAGAVLRLARAALDRQGQTQVRLIDLRHDFVLRQLEEHDWQYVSRITGVEAAGLDDLTRRDLRMDYDLRAGGEGQLLAQARARGWITRNDACELLGIGVGQCRPLLRRMLESGAVVQVRQRCLLNDPRGFAFAPAKSRPPAALTLCNSPIA